MLKLENEVLVIDRKQALLKYYAWLQSSTDHNNARSRWRGYSGLKRMYWDQCLKVRVKLYHYFASQGYSGSTLKLIRPYLGKIVGIIYESKVNSRILYVVLGPDKPLSTIGFLITDFEDLFDTTGLSAKEILETERVMIRLQE